MTVYDGFQHGLSVSPDEPCLGKRIYDPLTDTFGGYVWQTYTEVNDRIARFGSGLLKIHQDAHGLETVGQKWFVGSEAVTYGINHFGSSTVVTSANHVATLLSESSKMPGLKAIISMDDLDSGKAGPGLATTAPKGAIITHRNMIAPLAGTDVTLPIMPDACLISFLPLAHQMGRMVEIWLFSSGGKIGYGTGDILRLLEDMSYLKPMFFPTVSKLLNRIYAKMNAATAGAPGEIKLVDVPELNYFATDRPFPRGEICVRGPGVIPGYLKDEAKTKETIDILVHGDSTESCVVAIVIPEPEAFIPFVNTVLENVNLQPGELAAYKEILRDPKLTQAVLQELMQVGKETERVLLCCSFEIPKALLLESEPFTIENGLLTPTLKTKRHPVVQAYREQLTALYHEIRQKESKL
ncbi:hypothetical protein KVV02_000971 [Mortierella alpina]|uniref:AMP-dependent synthetase/ligase domain-containing protein n=1 Tax=Mortierella alpina TaxID=64518 RepID=A0A9P8D0Y0_MORAP|nr:hypothetical protein KVV02_000971 [Mortierella alpina]